MTARRLFLVIASLSLCALAHADTVQVGALTQTMATDLNFGALTATLTSLTALGMFLSFRRPRSVAIQRGATSRD